MEIQQAQRFVLDSCPGVTNFITKETFFNVLDKTLDSFITQLRSVCGPFSRYTLLLRIDSSGHTAAGSINDNRAFIKDGRYLIENSEYISPIENYIKSMILYIGTRIDSICHDGTTTGMLFACHLLKKMINYSREQYDKDGKSSFLREGTFDIEEHYSTAFEEIKSAMDKEKITLDLVQSFILDRKKAAKCLVVAQATTSSGGDSELAFQLAKFFDYMPECAWDDAIGTRIPAVENKDNRIEAIVNDYEMEIKAQCMSHLVNNFDNDRYYKNEDIDLLVVPDALPDSDISTMSLYQYIDTELNRPLVILIPNIGVGNSVIPTIHQKATNKNIKVIIESYAVPHNLTSTTNWEIEAICAKANKPLFMRQDGLDIKDCIIEHTSVLISRKWIKIDKLTHEDDREYPKNSHPGLTYPDDYIHYTRFKKKIDNELEYFENTHSENPKVIEFIKAANTAIHVKYPLVMKLGGMTHDMQAMVPVLEDCAGASMSTISNGAHLNGIFRLYKVANELAKIPHYYIQYAAIDHVREAALQTSLDIFGPIRESRNNFISKIENFNSNLEFIDLKEQDWSNLSEIIDTLVGSHVDTYLKGDFKKYCEQINEAMCTGVHSIQKIQIPPIQPAIFFDELLDRCKELILKVSVSESLVVPGGAWLDKNK